MTNALFTYRRKVMVGEEEVLNDNYINPLLVTSFFWQVNDKGAKVLSVFLANNYTIVFPESTGLKFVNHMEDFLRYTLGWGQHTPTPSYTHSDNPRKSREKRNPQPADIVENEIVEAPAATWQDSSVNA